MSYRDVPHLCRDLGLPAICLIAALGSVAVLPDAAARIIDDDARDTAVIVTTLNDVLEHEPSGKDMPWSNASTGHTGTIRIERTYYRGQQPCRDYTRKTRGGATEYEVRGVGCRLGKVNWETEEMKLGDPVAKAGDPSADPAAKKSAAPADPDRKAAARSAGGTDPPRDTTSPRPLQKAPPPQPTLQYSLPTRSQP